jgi:galactitol-specific phosphotransferase system IIB component
MRNLIKFLSALLFAALFSAGAMAQTSTQQAAQHLDAAQLVATSNTSAQTITITPPAGQYVYITEVDISNCAGASAVTAAAPTSITTTQLNGLTFQVGSGTTAGACQPADPHFYGNGLKSAAAGTAATFVMPTFANNQTVRLNVHYYFGT